MPTDPAMSTPDSPALESPATVELPADTNNAPSTSGGTPKQITVRACVACRQMKMKCEGADDPPCKRCQKVGRECIAQIVRPKGGSDLSQSSPRRTNKMLSPHPNLHPDRPSNTIISILTPSSVVKDSHSPAETVPLTTLGDSRAVVSRFEQSQALNLSELPSIYSTPPVDTVSEESKYQTSPRSSISVSRKRKRFTYALSSGQTTMSPVSSTPREIILTREEMKDMIQLFCQRHLPFIPALHYEDYENADYLIDKELPFVYCICYVTARYLPGGKDIRELLLPEISQYPRRIFAATSETQLDDWINLKALIVLYAYSDLTPPSQTSKSVGDEFILYWPLKYAVEVLALRLTLHRSIQDLRSDLQAGSPLQPESIVSYRKYTVWLWLFNMAHYCSIVSGTPPSIRIDYSIRCASSIVDKIGKSPRLNNLFGIVELYLIWEKASTNHPQLGEWWCLPDPADVVDENSVDDLIKETDRALDAWRTRWDDYIKHDDRGAFLEYHGRYTQFCITSYAVKCFRSSPQGLTPLQTAQIARCVKCANHVIDWPLNRGPIQKDRLRYVDDSACIMISFCALFILSTCQTFTSCIPDISECLNNVTEAAQLMVDLAINSEQKPYIQGAAILKRAEALRAALENARHNENRSNLDVPTDSREPFTPDSSNLVFEGLDSWFTDDNFFGMEPIWHFPRLLPDV